MCDNLKRKSGIIFAIDLESETSALRVAKEVYEYVDSIKIGYPLVLNAGLRIVKKIKKESNVPIIADFKVMDISSTATKIVKAAVNAGCDGVVICGVCGPTVISRCIEAARGKKVFVFTEFTHSDGLLSPKISNYTAKVAKELCVDGIFAPGTKPERIRELRNIVGDLIIACCGIGAQGPMPGSAIKAGADFEIIGRAIYDANNPKLAAMEIKRRIDSIIED
jgi:orotidine-5'-phosphate decarboxylase